MTDDDKKPANPDLSHPQILLATWFGAGYLPKAPGTWGALAALPFAWAIAGFSGPVGLVGASMVIFVIGIRVANTYMDLAGGDDPGPVVIDEVAGMWLTLAFVPPDLTLYAVGFVAFRIADILKPWPVGWADRTIRGGLGVMLDDVLAAVYAGAVVYALFYWQGV